MNLASAIAETATVTAACLKEGTKRVVLPVFAPTADYNLHPLWHVDGLKPVTGFVDIQNDVTLDDISLAMEKALTQ